MIRLTITKSSSVAPVTIASMTTAQREPDLRCHACEMLASDTFWIRFAPHLLNRVCDGRGGHWMSPAYPDQTRLSQTSGDISCTLLASSLTTSRMNESFKSSQDNLRTSRTSTAENQFSQPAEPQQLLLSWALHLPGGRHVPCPAMPCHVPCHAPGTTG